MSLKTLRSPKTSAIFPTAKRFALKRLHLACAVGLLALAPVPSFALELGEAALKSGLGETLLVQIPYRLATAEQLTPACVSVAAPRSADALPAYTRVSRIAVTPTHIEIFGAARVLEPLIGLTVEVRCEATPHFLRSFELFVDPPAPVPLPLSDGVRLAARPTGAASETANADTSRRPAASPPPETTVASAAAAPAARPPEPSARASGRTGGSVAQGEPYLVVRGDTLSGIASRVADRPGTIRETAEAIFAANPDAFTRGDADRLEAGRSISIPMLAAAPVAAPATAPPLPAEAAPSAVGVVPSAEPEPATAGEPVPRPADAPALAGAPETVVPPAVAEPPAAAVASVEPSPAPAVLPPDVASSATVERASPWPTALLALGIALALSGAWLLVRRRPPEAPKKKVVEVRSSPPRRLVDPLAGFDVVEGHLARSDASSGTASTSRHRAAPLRDAARAVAADEQGHIGPTDSVDLDVGTPETPDERVDWFGDRGDAAALAATVAAGEAPLDATATARMPEPSLADARPKPREQVAERSVAPVDDEQQTLTIVELDMLRQDYEAERTMTQQANQALRDALADLKATQAARAANAETATLEIPQGESIETQRTQRLRSAR